MLKENFKVAVPEFPDRKTSITAYGAVKNVYDDDTGRINARVINEAIKSMSSQGGGGRNGEHALPDHDKNQTSTGSGNHHSRRKKYGRYDNLCVGDRVVYRSGRSWSSDLQRYYDL